MNSRRAAFIGTIGLAGCALLLVALAIGGTHPASPRASAGPPTTVAAAAQSRYLMYSFSSSRSNPAPLGGSVPLVSIVVLVGIGIAIVAVIARQILRHGFDRSGFLMLLGLAATMLLAFEVMTAYYASPRRQPAKVTLTSPTRCQGQGTTIEMLSGGCRFAANGPSQWMLNDDLLPTDLEFETAAGEATLVSTNSNKPQYAVGIARCSTTSCTGHSDLSFVVFLGTLTKQDRARDFTRTTTFIDAAPGPSEWFESILSYLPHHTGSATKTPAPTAKHSFDWRAFLEELSGATLVGVVLALLGPVLLRLLRRRQDTDDAPDELVIEPDADQLLAGANEILEDETDPRTAVLGCWRELERFLDSRGFDRDPTETADELTTRLIQFGATSRRELVALHDLFIVARYSTRPFGESDREVARALLSELRESLATGDVVGIS